MHSLLYFCPLFLIPMSILHYHSPFFQYGLKNIKKSQKCQFFFIISYFWTWKCYLIVSIVQIWWQKCFYQKKKSFSFINSKWQIEHGVVLTKHLMFSMFFAIFFLISLIMHESYRNECHDNYLVPIYSHTGSNSIWRMLLLYLAFPTSL